MMPRDPNDFSDLDDFDSAPTTSDEQQPAELHPYLAAQAKHAMVPCTRCGGTGIRFGGKCFGCNGAGKITTRQAAARKGMQTAANNRNAWRETHKAELTWLANAAARGFRIAQDLQSKLSEYGKLTDNQIALVQRFMKEDEERRTKMATQPNARAVVVDTAGADALHASLKRALANGLKNPALKIGEFKFSLAKATSANAGAVYVKAGSTYLGKIIGGNFSPGRDCTDTQRAAVAETMHDPLEAARLHGQRTGQCSCCGRELTNAESIELGIGPICREKFFG